MTEGGEMGGYEGGESGGERGGFDGSVSGGESKGFDASTSNSEKGGFDGGKTGGDAEGFDGGKIVGDAEGFNGGIKSDGEKGDEINPDEKQPENAETTEGRSPVESEKNTEKMLDAESPDYTHQTILDENLQTLSKREANSIVPDHMAAYDQNGNVIKGNDYSQASHFEVVEDKNYSIESSSGRGNLVSNICKQAENRNNALGVNGATVHQTYRVDLSGHDNISLYRLEALYENLNNKLPDNVDVEFVLK